MGLCGSGDIQLPCEDPLSVDLEETDLAYLAGLIEGEGYIGIVRQTPNHKAVLRFNMKDEGALRWLAGILDLKTNLTKEGFYHLSIPPRIGKDLIEDSLPFFKIDRKGREANLYLSFVGTIEDHEWGGGQRKPLSIEILKYRSWLWEEMQRTKHNLFV